ncbi:MAG: cation transporter [Firmicutes bacterium]|nr:cation transporter [Bacillota bacterium]
MSNNAAKPDRDRVIVRTSLTGIAVNILLAVFKAGVGVLSHSIAVILDAVNNLSDALSSVITIIGAKIASRKPDKKHPLGHGRVEYLSAMLVSAIVLYAGITSAVESVKKILHPETPEYGTVSLVIIAVAIVAKILLGRYVKAQGEKVNSTALIASGSDASFDAILSFSVLVSALIFTFSGISLEAWVGVVISGFIIKAGMEMMQETLDDILGHRAEDEVVARIKEIISEEPYVRGTYDIFITNYGPDRELASLHIELPDTMTVEEVDRLTRRIESRVYSETGVIVTGVGVYSYNTTDDKASMIRDRVQQIVLSHDWVLQMHGFYADTVRKTLRFDAVLDFKAERGEAIETLRREVAEAYPDYDLNIIGDVDISG